MTGLGWLVVGFCAVHGGNHLLRGHPEDLLWVCYVANVLVAAGLLGRWPALVGIGTLWLITGLPLWLLDIAGGGELIPTSVLPHFGGLVAGLIGARALGMPAGVWWRATAALLALTLACRWVTPRAANVNACFNVWRGWDAYFKSYPIYVVVVTAFHGVVFFALEQLLSRWVIPA